MKASYSKRIQRPQTQLLNSFYFYENPLTRFHGNPLLRPEYTDAYELDQDTPNLAIGYTRMDMNGRTSSGPRRNNLFMHVIKGGPAGGGQAAGVACPNCGKQNAPGAKFCADCGGKMEVAKVPCVKCGAQLREGAKFCSECGSSQEKAKCANCQAELAPGAKFCPECGTKTEEAA